MDPFCVATLSASVLLMSIIWYITLKPAKRTAPLPPGPRGLPIVGYLPFMAGKNLLQKFTDLGQVYGPIYKLNLGYKPCVVITSPSLAKEVLRDHDAVFANRSVPAAAVVASFGRNDVAWSDNNSQWRSMRKILVQKMMSNAVLDASYDLRKEEVRKTIRSIYGTNNIGKPIEVGELVFGTLVNVMMNMLWGETIRGEERERVGAEFWVVMTKLVDLIAKPNISDFYPVLARFDIQGVQKEMKGHVQSMERIFDRVIAEHEKKLLSGEIRNQGKKDFLTILLEMKEKQDSEISITERHIKAILSNIIGGGTDTSTNTAEWAMAELMNNPKVMTKAQKELSEVVGLNNIVEEFHIPNLKYLKAIAMETLRLHPAGILLAPRSPSQSSIVGGYTIPKSTCILINVAAIQRDPCIWDNPTEFKPERFLDNHESYDLRGNNFHFLPFGSGRRSCAGISLAERMVIYLLASLLHSFEWELPDGETLDMSEKFGVLLRKSTPLVVIPKARLSDPNLYL